jgi:predicted nucleic acid-binding protein
MVAAVCAWHEHHERAAAAVNERLDARQTMVVPSPALIETYAVLTRLPPPHRLSARDAWQLVDANFARGSRIVALEGDDYVELLRSAREAAVVGGRIYDAVIARCVIKGRASSVLTFNDEHFRSLGIADLEILVP